MTRVLDSQRRRGGPAAPTPAGQPATSHDQRAIVHDILAETVALYRSRARRLLWLASTAAFEEAKLEFLALARRYDVLAEHTAAKAQGLQADSAATAADAAPQPATDLSRRRR